MSVLVGVHVLGQLPKPGLGLLWRQVVELFGGLGATEDGLVVEVGLVLAAGAVVAGVLGGEGAVLEPLPLAGLVFVHVGDGAGSQRQAHDGRRGEHDQRGERNSFHFSSFPLFEISTLKDEKKNDFLGQHRVFSLESEEMDTND